MKNISRIIWIPMVLIFIGLWGITANALNTRMYLSGTKFEAIDSFDVTSYNRQERFVYGKNSLGTIFLEGDIVENKEYNGVQAYGVNDCVQLRYSYDGSLNNLIASVWQLSSSDKKSVCGINLSKNVGEGTIIVQTSKDGRDWKNVCEKKDCFGKANNVKDQDLFYTTSVDEIMQGTYYRILVAYQMKRQTKEAALFQNAEYEYRNCIEEYVYFICTNQNYVVLRDLSNKSVLASDSSVYRGFYIDKCGSEDEVIVRNGKGGVSVASQNDSYLSAGEYKVEITTKLGKKYVYNVNVREGYSYITILPQVFESDKNTGFGEDKKIQNTTTAGIKSLTSLKIAQDYGFTTTQSTVNGFDAYGVNGSSACLMLHLNYSESLLDNGWYVEYDSYGKKEKEKVCNVQTGEIGKGAVIVQYSLSGTENTWLDLNKSKYSNGLYTTNFGEYYKSNEDIVLYTPEGIQRGLYFRVIYVYQIYNKTEKQYVDCKEKYEFYLCSSELGAVQFHNLSLEKDSFEKTYGDVDSNTIALLKNAETLISNTGTTTGFSIDTTKNPTVKYIVEKDGEIISEPQNGKYTETGRYDILLSSAVGTNQKVTIYVDRMNDTQSIYKYFGKSFIQGKRIYAEDNYPIYEGGSTTYNLEAITDSYLPIYGTISNISTGEQIKIITSRDKRTGILTTPGEYEAIFKTGFNDNSTIGDVKSFTFKFKIIPQGTAPGPRNNKNLLEEYAHTNVSDSYPIYYGVKYPSASSNPITIAFKDRKSAVDYVYNYEYNAVELLSDGTYRYNGSEDSIKFDDNVGIDLPKVIYEFAERAVRPYYFDISDDSTYITLMESDIKATDNLRRYELNRSIVIYGENEKEKLTDLDALPIISRKPYSYITPGKDGVVQSGYNDFEFIHDKYGCDSENVVITDCNGDQYEIEYGGGAKNKGVGKQLQDKGCATGVVTITETTAWGDVANYQAIFIRENDNTSMVNLAYYQDGQEKKISMNISSCEEELVVDAFSVERIVDEIDPYSLVIISKDGKILQMYAADQFTKGAWSEEGKYSIKVVNRLGYGYVINIVVNDSDYSVLSFQGEGTENIKDIISSFGMEDVALPKLEKEGYKFIGYKDNNGKLYTDCIDKVTTKGTIELTTEWEVATVRVVLLNTDNSVYTSYVAYYGSELFLPTLAVSKKSEFCGWMYEDTLYTNIINISSFDTMTLIPVIKNKKTGVIEMGGKKVEEKNDIKRLSKPVVIMFIIGGMIVIRKFKRKKGG